MMEKSLKIQCACGQIIPDQTDYLPYKGYVIGDKDWFDLWNLIEDIIEGKTTLKTNDEKIMAVLRADPSRLAYECSGCGRLYLDDADHQLVEYLPQNSRYNRIFDRDVRKNQRD